MGLLIFATVSYDAQPGKMHSSEATKRELLKGTLVGANDSNPSNSSSQRRELLKGTLAGVNDSTDSNPSNSSSLSGKGTKRFEISSRMISLQRKASRRIEGL